MMGGGGDHDKDYGCDGGDGRDSIYRRDEGGDDNDANSDDGDNNGDTMVMMVTVMTMTVLMMGC